MHSSRLHGIVGDQLARGEDVGVLLPFEAITVPVLHGYGSSDIASRQAIKRLSTAHTATATSPAVPRHF